MTTCDKCGQEILIGEWPFCPHGSNVTFGEDSIDYVDEMIAEEPVRFTSRLQRRKFMDKQGLDFRAKLERHVGSVQYCDLGKR